MGWPRTSILAINARWRATRSVRYRTWRCAISNGVSRRDCRRIIAGFSRPVCWFSLPTPDGKSPLAWEAERAPGNAAQIPKRRLAWQRAPRDRTHYPSVGSIREGLRTYSPRLSCGPYRDRLELSEANTLYAVPLVRLQSLAMAQTDVQGLAGDNVTHGTAKASAASRYQVCVISHGRRPFLFGKAGQVRSEA